MVASRSEPKLTDYRLAHGIPIFLDQLIETLTIEEASEPIEKRMGPRPASLLHFRNWLDGRIARTRSS